jgi:ribosomal protein L11 methyltransferase
MLTQLAITFNTEAPAQAELVRAVFEGNGIPATDITEETRRGRTRLYLYFASQAAALRCAKAVRLLRLAGARVRLKQLADDSWKTRWKKYFRPFDITPDIRLIPGTARAKAPGKGKRAIFIDTTFAFGTGLHATTRMMARLIRSFGKDSLDFLDVGTGSGILAVIAAVYGCREVWAFDNDPQAVKTAGVNFRRNGLSPCFLGVSSVRTFKPGKRFGFVAANLITDELLRSKRKLFSLVAPGGCLAVSGIYRDNYRFFRKKFKDRRFVLARAAFAKGWHAALLRRKRR